MTEDDMACSGSPIITPRFGIVTENLIENTNNDMADSGCLIIPSTRPLNDKAAQYGTIIC